MKKSINSKKIIGKIEQNKKEIKSKGVKKIGVFGSFVKGKENGKSDIDILVSFNKVSYKNYIELLILLEKMFNRKIDLVIEDDLKPELKYVKKEAKYVKI
ncbi:nucleotidyltransferase domain-containing protein [Candidatus Pacearchaeota archaeon]|nr:nucleotidyltransferase domain-containing protein [Candidatus Pacearchaeota archaeon]